MNWLKNLFAKLGSFFASDKGKQMIETINTVTETALPVVAQIASLTGNKGAEADVAAVQAAYTNYGVPLAQTLVSGDKTQIGDALKNLAVTVVQKNLPPAQASTATSLIQTGVQLAVVASKLGN